MYACFNVYGSGCCGIAAAKPLSTRTNSRLRSFHSLVRWFGPRRVAVNVARRFVARSRARAWRLVTRADAWCSSKLSNSAPLVLLRPSPESVCLGDPKPRTNTLRTHGRKKNCQQCLCPCSLSPPPRPHSLPSQDPTPGSCRVAQQARAGTYKGLFIHHADTPTTTHSEKRCPPRAVICSATAAFPHESAVYH